MLEHHADLAADRVDVLEVVGQFDPVDDNLALLMFLEPRITSYNVCYTKLLRPSGAETG